VAIPGETNGVLALSNVTEADSATYTVTAMNAEGVATSRKAVVVVELLPGNVPVVSVPQITNTVSVSKTNEGSSHFSTLVSSRLANLSVRSIPGPGERALLVGFVVAGGNKTMLIRGVGPALAKYTNDVVFQDPAVTIFDSLHAVASNDDWGGTAVLKNNFARLGAFPFPDDSRDSAVLEEFTPRSYTMSVSGDGTGLGMAEIYDGDSPMQGSGRLINFSARAHAGPGSGVLIVGFVISGNTPLQVLIRAVGPSLSDHGITSTLADPHLAVYRGNVLLQQNDDWAGADALKSAFARSGAFAFRNTDSKDAAMVATLTPGAYTAIVSGVDGSHGIALAEVYELR
jgi:hypothetical protein